MHLIPKMCFYCDIVTYRILQNEELNDLYSSLNIVRVRWAGHVAHMGGSRGLYRVLVGKPEGKRPLGTPKCRLLTYLLHGAGNFLRS